MSRPVGPKPSPSSPPRSDGPSATRCDVNVATSTSGPTVVEADGTAKQDRFTNAAPAQSRAVDVVFTPTDDARALELAWVDKVISARKADSRTFTRKTNPYRIRYAAYNLRSKTLFRRLIEAAKAGVDVQVLLDEKQLRPEKKNQIDEEMEAAGLSVIRSDKGVNEATRAAANLVGIESHALMHLKTRVFSYEDASTGDLHKVALSGSANPFAGWSNDENVNEFFDEDIIAVYEQKIDDVLMHRKTVNSFDATEPVNVLFTPTNGGPRPLEKLFEWIDDEDELILINVFDLNNIVDPKSKKTLVQKLTEAKARGAEVMVITDRKHSDGRGRDGKVLHTYGRPATDDPTDELLEAAGIPVYEGINDATPYTSIHGKVAIFGARNPRVVTGAGNWTKSSLGSGKKKARNAESFIFVDTAKLDDEGYFARRYLSNFIYLLDTYAPDDTAHPDAADAKKVLFAQQGWPTIDVEPASLLPAGVDEGWLIGDHPTLKGRGTEPGLRISRSALSTRSQPLVLPLGADLTLQVLKSSTAEIKVSDTISLAVVEPKAD